MASITVNRVPDFELIHPITLSFDQSTADTVINLYMDVVITPLITDLYLGSIGLFNTSMSIPANNNQLTILDLYMDTNSSFSLTGGNATLNLSVGNLITGRFQVYDQVNSRISMTSNCLELSNANVPMLTYDNGYDQNNMTTSGGQTYISFDQNGMAIKTSDNAIMSIIGNAFSGTLEADQRSSISVELVQPLISLPPTINLIASTYSTINFQFVDVFNQLTLSVSSSDHSSINIPLAINADFDSIMVNNSALAINQSSILRSVYTFSSIVVLQSNATILPPVSGNINITVSGHSSLNITAPMLRGNFQVSDQSTVYVAGNQWAYLNLNADGNSHLSYISNGTIGGLPINLAMVNVSNNSSIYVSCPDQIIRAAGPSPCGIVVEKQSNLIITPQFSGLVNIKVSGQSTLNLPAFGLGGTFQVSDQGSTLSIFDTFPIMTSVNLIADANSYMSYRCQLYNDSVITGNSNVYFGDSIQIQYYDVRVNISLLLGPNSTLVNHPPLYNVSAVITVDQSTLAIIGTSVSGNFTVMNGGSLSISDNDDATVLLSGSGANSLLNYTNTADKSATINVQALDQSTITTNCSNGAILGNIYVGGGSEVTLGPASATSANSQSTILMEVEQKSSLLVQFPLALTSLDIKVNDQSTVSLTNTSSFSKISINATNNSVITIDCPGGGRQQNYSTVTLDNAKSVSATGYGNIVLEQQSSLVSKAHLVAANLTLLSGSKMQLDGTILVVANPVPNIGSFVTVSEDSSIEFKNPFSSSSFSAATMTCTSESFLFHGQAIVSFDSKNPAHDTYRLIDVTMPQSTPYTMVWPKSTDVAPTLTFPTKFSVDFTNNRMTLNIHGMTMGSFIGILVGSAVAFAVLVVGAVFLFYRRWKKTRCPNEGYSIINDDK
ncbi:hypothetical protein SAMD00019534_086540 [Acytostelium subglobosum LB1]|uniref:hypothetical protein n=1 Tax=Acytostelium subglobosum LB1 TaxID=1410327 RepID=UPI000644D6E6|nr:hypothetical protein SAMD00019534_086540 [Acytostelium subglobosum LB1]GAM25479.1 hypothetical protein SAMD00019534_086540 [Acytostelium subglobosum LB1]|eukprot:XP_012751465.1 hypothetical protein SAMD00019534_086540 [Acytostelium subglobosum LB1]